MAQPSNGITPEVIRDIMPPYHLSADLVQATFAAIPAPPSDASTPWREARITRLLEEVVAARPADAEQARIAAQRLIIRELADTVTAEAHAPGVTSEELCRLSRAAAALHKTVASLDRMLTRLQQKPVPFFGTVVKDAVDIAAVNANWRSHPTQPDAASTAPPPRKPPNAATPAPQPDAARPEPHAVQPATASPMADQPSMVPPAPQPAEPPATEAPTPLDPTPLDPTPLDPTPLDPTPLEQSPEAAAPNNGDAATTPEWSFTLLDQGPGWTREVLRHRSSGAGGNAAGPRSST